MVGTVKAAIADVTKIFIDDRQPTDPFHDPKTRELYPDVGAQLSYYHSNDPPTHHQEAMSPPHLPPNPQSHLLWLHT